MESRKYIESIRFYIFSTFMPIKFLDSEINLYHDIKLYFFFS